MTALFLTNLLIEPGYDHRDEIGGGVRPLGLIFELVGPSASVKWGIDTGWVHRPVVTATLKPGPQDRHHRPGVDHQLTQGFPQPLTVSFVDADADTGSAEADRAVPDYEWYLMETLFTGGAPAVFEVLRNIYDTHVS